MLVDSHCHIHESTYPDADAALARARTAGVGRIICVGTDERTSREAVAFAERHEEVWASIGLHPHDATSGVSAIEDIRQLAASPHVVAVGECGLDYYYDNSPRHVQAEMLHAQLSLARDADLPVIFHVREAFDDFWQIFDQYQGIRGVIHSFTDTKTQLDNALARGLYIGVNGIATFARSAEQQAMYRAIPPSSLLLETDAPFLTPVPHRGKVNEPAFVTLVAQYIANLQSIDLSELSRATSQNATHLFSKTQS